MAEIFNMLIKQYLGLRYRRIERFIARPFETQEKIFNEIIHQNKKCEFGQKHGFKEIENYETFQSRLAISEYNDFAKDIQRMINGEKDVLTPGKTSWFAKSSGTSNDRSKFIPVTKNYLLDCHMKSSWDVVTILYNQNSNLKVFAYKNLIMGGSIGKFSSNPSASYGDISGVMVENMPVVGRPYYSPDFETALLSNWEEKIEKMTKQCSYEDIILFGGVPTWVIVLFEKILEFTGKNNMAEVWPNVSGYIHGGVNFEPYKEQFKSYIPKDDFQFLEVYNASEGYFAIQDDSARSDMLLLLDNSIFYEFIPFDNIEDENPKAITLEDVELNEIYSLVITNTSGLYRYVVGDTIEFTSLHPFRIKIVGRNKHYINVFGEEVMVSNTDKAIGMTAKKFNVSVSDYTVAPIFLTNETKGGHEWIVEFKKPPEDVEKFAKQLDKSLQNINSDYEAKRSQNLALEQLSLHIAPPGPFSKWMKQRNKLGGQNKVPRLSNSRKHLEEILTLIS